MPRTMTREISNSDDVIDSRDVIARIEHLAQLRQPGPVDLDCDDNDNAQDDLFAELVALEKLADEGANSADDWDHGASLIRDSYFVDYCRDLVSDIGDMPREIPHYIVIDWDATADNLRADYSSVDFDGVTYWVRWASRNRGTKPMRSQILPNGNLLITADNADRSDLADACHRSYDHAEYMIAEQFRDYLEFIRPEAIGALTSAPILTDDADYSDEVMNRFRGPEPYPDANVWWFPDYAVRDPWEELSRNGRVVFTKAD